MPFEGPLLRGDVVRVRLNPVQGSEQGGERPALVVSPDLINRNNPVILVAAITTKKVERVYPFEVLVDQEGGLQKRSKVMLMQLRAVDRLRIVERLGHLSGLTMASVDDAVRIATGVVPL